MSDPTTCHCAHRWYVRSLEEDDFGFPGVVAIIAQTKDATLHRCRVCGAWWERVPHYVYGYAWYQTEQGYWDTEDEQKALAGWAVARREVTV
jgi:hypothetical protein